MVTGVSGLLSIQFDLKHFQVHSLCVVVVTDN